MCVRGSGKGWRDGGRAAGGKSDTRRRRSETLRRRRRRRGGAAALATPPTPAPAPAPGPAPPRSRRAPAPAGTGRPRGAGKGWRAVWGAACGAPGPSARLCSGRCPGRSGAVPAPGDPRATCLAVSGDGAGLGRGLGSARAGLGSEGRGGGRFGERSVEAVGWERSWCAQPAPLLLLRRGSSGLRAGSRA